MEHDFRNDGALGVAKDRNLGSLAAIDLVEHVLDLLRVQSNERYRVIFTSVIGDEMFKRHDFRTRAAAEESGATRAGAASVCSSVLSVIVLSFRSTQARRPLKAAYFRDAPSARAGAGSEPAAQRPA